MRSNIKSYQSILEAILNLYVICKHCKQSISKNLYISTELLAIKHIIITSIHTFAFVTNVIIYCGKNVPYVIRANPNGTIRADEAHIIPCNISYWCIINLDLNFVIFLFLISGTLLNFSKGVNWYLFRFSDAICSLLL